jgi:hypothetical protein
MKSTASSSSHTDTNALRLQKLKVATLTPQMHAKTHSLRILTTRTLAAHTLAAHTLATRTLAAHTLATPTLAAHIRCAQLATHALSLSSVSLRIWTLTPFSNSLLQLPAISYPLIGVPISFAKPPVTSLVVALDSAGNPARRRYESI